MPTTLSQKVPKITKRKALAIFMLVTYVIFIIVFAFSIKGLTFDVLSAPERRSYLLPINLNLNGTMGFGNPDITLCLNFTYPRGALIVDESVDIIGLSVLRGSAMSNVSMILVTFQNCLENGSYDIFHFPKQAYLVFNNSDHNRGLTFDDSGKIVYIFCDDTQAYWSLDGDFKPIVGVFFADNTNKTMIIDDVIIHVYPREQLTQMQSNSVSLILSIAGLILGSVVVIEIFYNLWDEDGKCKYPKNEFAEPAKTQKPKITTDKQEAKTNHGQSASKANTRKVS
ncbi:MAG: hypothetical protein M1490_05965 [Candidatus Bathyarchaeota archaeon]|nr:hypothetical protein [Candidatus Bathyarchaeota archaeon]